MTESVVNFGPESALVGILSQPTKAFDRKPAVVLLNAGVIHRTGPNRIHVRLARALASAGIPSLRIDMAGIGDSRGFGSTASQDEECLRSIKAAVDLLEMNGTAERVILYGACSGAEYAFRYARRDPRVVGVAGVDPPTLARSRKYYLVRASRAVRRPVVWYRLVTGRYGVIGKIRSLPVWIPKTPGPAATSEERDETAAGLAEMVSRDVQLLLLITGAAARQYNYESQVFDIFPHMGLEEVTNVVMFPEAGHTFAREAGRVALESTLLHWIGRAPFSSPPVGVTAARSHHVRAEALPPSP